MGSPELERVLGAAWPAVLEHLEDAVLVLDEERILRFVNDRARRLLGYDGGDRIGGRCRLTTQGVDCETACPLTYALKGELDSVEGFRTVYRSRDGHPVPLHVTVIPLRDGDGTFRGAVEILRPQEADPGFMMAGRGAALVGLRERAAVLAERCEPVVLVGERVACFDVARGIHRLSGIDEQLFVRWPGRWRGVEPWPPGTAYANGRRAADLLDRPAPEGWRLIAGVRTLRRLRGIDVSGIEVVQLPSARELDEDLPLVIAAWVRQLDRGIHVSPDAVQRLCEMARQVGLDRLSGVLTSAVAAADDRLEAANIPVDGYRAELIDELLEADNPMAALEEKLLREVLSRSEWRMQEAADRLGVSRVTLWRKIKEHGIERPDEG